MNVTDLTVSKRFRTDNTWLLYSYNDRRRRQTKQWVKSCRDQKRLSSFAHHVYYFHYTLNGEGLSISHPKSAHKIFSFNQRLLYNENGRAILDLQKQAL